MSLIADTNEIELLVLRKAYELVRARQECSPEMQQAADDMMAIIVDPDTDPDDRDMATHTLADVLYPHRHDEKLGLDLEEAETMGAVHDPEVGEIFARFDAEEATFAERLRSALDSKGMTQEQLADAAGVGQPAISNMLNRQCRPQRRTVERFATALGVAPEELWPAFSKAN
jgi:lambda repressor-like predicted transcriptional regulator